MKTIGWKSEPKGPGAAVHTFLDAGGERVELLAFDVPPFAGNRRIIGFEVYGRLRKGGPFHELLANGEADTRSNAMRAALEMVSRPRAYWELLPGRWRRDRPR